jgi:hypothetical protein
MQVASRDCRILMAGDPLQDVQIDASTSHPGHGGVPEAVADQACLPKRGDQRACRVARPAVVAREWK